MTNSDIRALADDDYAGHTPGPWAIYNHAVNLIDVGPPRSGLTAQVARWRDGARGDWRENNANANLVAAAPQLLEALRQVLRERNELAKAWDLQLDSLSRLIDGEEARKVRDGADLRRAIVADQQSAEEEQG